MTVVRAKQSDKHMFHLVISRARNLYINDSDSSIKKNTSPELHLFWLPLRFVQWEYVKTSFIFSLTFPLLANSRFKIP